MNRIGAQSARVLLVEGDVTVRLLIESLLKKEGHSVCSVDNGEQGLEKLQEGHEFELLILNLHMPILDGFQVLKRLKEDLKSTLPVLFLTARNDAESMDRAFELGADDFLQKPFNSSELKARVKNLIKLTRYTKSMKHQKEVLMRFVPEVFLHKFNSDELDLRDDNSNEYNYSVIFSDIRSFSSFSEKVSSSDVFHFLNSYFRQVEPVIQANDGFIYQFLGDGVLSMYPLVQDKYADNVIRCAIALHEKVKEYSAFRVAQGLNSIQVGVGINTGPVAAGIVGTKNRMDAGAYGNTVNVAARCETLSKKYSAKIMITENTFKQLEHPEKFIIRPLGRTPVKGLQKNIGIYEVLDAEEPEMRELKLRHMQTLNYAIDLVEKGDLIEAFSVLADMDSSEDRLPECLIENIKACYVGKI